MTLLQAFSISASALCVTLGAVRVVTGWSPFEWLFRKIREEYRCGLRDVITEEVGPRLDAIRAELDYNNGHSVKDMVHRIATTLDIDVDVNARGRRGEINRRHG